MERRPASLITLDTEGDDLWPPHVSWKDTPGDPQGAGGPDYTCFPASLTRRQEVLGRSEFLGWLGTQYTVKSRKV